MFAEWAVKFGYWCFLCGFISMCGLVSTKRCLSLTTLRTSTQIPKWEHCSPFLQVAVDESQIPFKAIINSKSNDLMLFRYTTSHMVYLRYQHLFIFISWQFSSSMFVWVKCRHVLHCPVIKKMSEEYAIDAWRTLAVGLICKFFSCMLPIGFFTLKVMYLFYARTNNIFNNCSISNNPVNLTIRMFWCFM